MTTNNERERMETLINRKYLTGAEFEELQENQFVVETDNLGYSANNSDYYWYDVTVVQQGYLPEDDDCKTERYNIYVEVEKEEE